MLRCFLVILASLSSLSAWAECTQYQVTWRGQAGPWSSTKEAACSAINGMSYTSSTDAAGATLSVSGARVVQSDTCAYKQSITYNSNGQTDTWDASTSISRRVVATCGDPICESQRGQSKVVNFTVGYTRSSDIDADPNWKLIGAPNKVPASGLLCNPTSPCELRFDGFSDSDMAWQSAAPTPNGLYRLSLDISATVTGETCTPTELDNAALSKTAPIPPCPGFTGEVNGVLGCYGTASNPTSNDVSDPKPKPPEAGNPTAGEKPNSGEGSGTGGAGRTPSTGDGGPGGGPAGAAGSGTKPDGTTPKPGEGKEQANCGAPGQAKCSINETGTPDGKGSFDAANSGLEEGKKGWIAEIEKVKDLTAPGWTWTFQLPSGCTALDVPAFNLTLDVCRFQPIIHDIMSMLWAIATVMGCALMVFNATGKN